MGLPHLYGVLQKSLFKSLQWGSDYGGKCQMGIFQCDHVDTHQFVIWIFIWYQNCDVECSHFRFYAAFRSGAMVACKQKSIKNRLIFRWKPRFRWRRKNFDLHAITGFYISMVALLMALTGLFWAFEWFSETVKWAANGGKVIERGFPESKVTDSTPIDALDEVENYLYAKAPETKIFMIRFPSHEASPFVARAYPTEDKNYNRTTFYFDQYSGEALKTESFETVDAGEKVNLLNYDLHVGSILGIPGKIIAFFASLLSASLPVTGFFIWWGKRRSNRVSTKPASVSYSTVSSEL